MIAAALLEELERELAAAYPLLAVLRGLPLACRGGGRWR